jgi:hypothetical protein
MSCKKSCQGISYNEYYANKRYECPSAPCPTPCPTPYTPCVPYSVCDILIGQPKQCLIPTPCHPKLVCDILIGQQKKCPVPTPCVTVPVCDVLTCNETKFCPIQPCKATPVCDILADRCEMLNCVDV